MRIVKWLLTNVLGMLLLIDGIVAYRLMRYGRPKRLVGTMVDNNTAQIFSVPIPMDAAAWVALGIYFIVHVVLCFAVWRAWRSACIQSSGTTNHV